MLDPNTDATLERLRERADDYYVERWCPVCDVQLTEADVEAEECTNCHTGVGVDDESADEDLWQPGDDFDGWDSWPDDWVGDNYDSRD